MRVRNFIIVFLIVFVTVVIVHLAEDAQFAKSDAKSFLQKQEERVLLSAVEAIGKRDPTERGPVPVLIAAMDNESHRVRSAAARALLRIGPVNKQIVLAFIRVSRDNVKDVIYATDDFFRLLCPEHRYMIPELVRMAEAPDPRSRRLAIRALIKIGDIPAELVPALVEAAGDHRHDGPHAYAIAALKILGPKANAAVPYMMEMLGKKSLTERSTAALTLAAIGTQEAREAIPVIEQYVREAPFVDLCRSLLQFDSKSTVAIQGLENIAKDPGPHAGDVPDAHYYLIRAGHNPEYHLQALIEGLESEGFGKLSSATHLGILGHLATKAIPFLQKTLKDDNPEVRVAAAHSILLISLKPTERKQAVDVIFNAVEEKVFMARLRVFSALEAFGSDESWAVPKLTALATNTTIRQERFRINAVKALGNIGSGAAESLPALRRLLKDDHWQVRKNAHEAIKKIESQPEKNILNN